MKHLNEKDLIDGKKIAHIFESLTEEDKNQCLVYMSALRDKEMMQMNKKAEVQ